MEKLTLCGQIMRDLNWYRLLGVTLDMHLRKHLKCLLPAVPFMENYPKEVIKDVGRVLFSKKSKTPRKQKTGICK